MERAVCFDVGKIGLAALIERRGHADHDSVHFGEAREIVGGGKKFGANVLLDLSWPGMWPM
jgi:hypothetical protein